MKRIPMAIRAHDKGAWKTLLCQDAIPSVQGTETGDKQMKNDNPRPAMQDGDSFAYPTILKYVYTVTLLNPQTLASLLIRMLPAT